ncbi:SagB-type dehydrogenase domain-containing protein [Malonomonas rubra DSM 5091]|uniref:SagB-type dehydrogenase domain-containing protein n=1 Tax=Malonomonas rubra DSM 5091 TaxID=1122189 RepID=A0A1M6MMH1_MALRU|nr:SagB/ThcOx family dehydrogenase [Malonomonas rubra]SHJ84580.1 SagB-type dehydrogenase domain-containing protein [Malonomonas rubra DSM 5091]
MDKAELSNYREFLRDNLRLQLNFHLTDQNQGIAPPPVQKPIQQDQTMIALPSSEQWQPFSSTRLLDAITNRRSHRRYTEAGLTLAEFSFLLWSTQGCRGVISPGTALRTVPSAGCRHPFETYLAITNVEGLQPGIYRYLPVDHALVLEHAIEVEELRAALTQATLNQTFTATAPVTFIWSVVPARSEWRYHTAAHRVILMDVGHLCQNLYLSCEAVGCGCCAIAAYHQEKMDELLKVDGDEEFTIYLAPVGKV